MTADDEFEQIEGQLRAAIALVFAPLAARGKATVAYEVDRMGCHRIQPSNPNALAFAVVLQGPAEISLFPEEPGSGHTLTADIYDPDAEALIARVEGYLRAIATGRVELTVHRSGRAGRCRVWIDGDEPQNHLYNLVLGRRLRGWRWRTFTPEPY